MSDAITFVWMEINFIENVRIKYLWTAHKFLCSSMDYVNGTIALKVSCISILQLSPSL